MFLFFQLEYNFNSYSEIIDILSSFSLFVKAPDPSLKLARLPLNGYLNVC